MALPRANRELNEYIDYLDAKYAEAGKDPRRAWESLSSDDIAFITHELAKVLKDPPYYLKNYHFIRTKRLLITTIYPLYDSQQLLLDEVMKQFVAGVPIRAIVLKSRQQGICLDPSTKVLTADLKWKPIADLRIGEELVSVDESPAGGHRHRKMRTGMVEGVVQVQRQAYRITFEDGRTLVCTGQHPWLSKSPSNTQTFWMSIEGNHLCGKKLKPGCQVRWVTKPWGEPTFEDGWFGGILDGEGSQSNNNRAGSYFKVSQSEGPVLDAIIDYCRKREYHYRIKYDEPGPGRFGHVRVPFLEMSRMDEIFQVMGQCRPKRLTRRFWEDRELPGKKSGIGWSTIVSIEPLGVQTMIDLQTSLSTYIAEGFVSHNTTLGVALMFWLVSFHPMCHVLSMSDEDERVKVNFDMGRIAFKYLPWWMRPDKRYDLRPRLLGFDRGKRDDREESSGLESMLYFESANQPSGSAYSKSLYGTHLAELGRYRDADTITDGIFGSLVELAHSFGLMEGTAQGRGTTFHTLWKMAEAGKFWPPVFMEWFREPGYCVSVPENFELTYEEKAIVHKVKDNLKYDLSLGQMAWRRKMKSQFEAAGKEERFPQEFPIDPVEAFISSGITAFPKKRLGEMSTNFGRKAGWVGEIRLGRNNKTPILQPYVEGKFEMWENPKKGWKYQVGADCALGIENADYSAAVVYCIPNEINKPIRQVARWRGYMAPTEFARVLCAIGYLYNEAQIAPEVNKITTVTSDLNIWLEYPNIYRWMREDVVGNPLSRYVGWQTNTKNRNELIGRFRDALLAWTVIIRSDDDISEMYDFVETEPNSGRFEAQGEAHDDTVFAHMIGYYTATQFRPRYGAEPEEEKQPIRSYQELDYSPIYDQIDDQHFSYGPKYPTEEPSFMEL